MGEVVRDGTGRFLKGAPSPNPGGRPRGLAATVREATDLDSLLATLLGIASDPTARAADRIRACELLLDRGWGKAPSFQPIDGDPLQLDDVDLAIRGVIDELLARRTGTADNN